MKTPDGSLPYPLVLYLDRFGGCYSGGKWLAFNRFIEAMPQEVDDGDCEAMGFWGSDREGVVGKGETPELAIEDLIAKLKEKEGAE